MRCVDNLPNIANGAITYTPPPVVSFDVLPPGQRLVGTIATYSCSLGYQPVGGSSLRACVHNGNGMEQYCCKYKQKCNSSAQPDKYTSHSIQYATSLWLLTYSMVE